MNRRTLILFLLLAGCGSSSTSTSALTDCSAVTDTWSTYGQSFFATNCRTCHEHTSQFGSQSAVLNSINSIESEISSGAMPEGTTLSATDKTRILSYLACGAP